MQRPWYAHYDPGVPHEVEYPEVPVWHLLKESAERYGDLVALDFLGHRLTYRALWESVQRFAHALQATGLEPGERVAIMLPNSPQFVIAFYGTLLAGGVVVNTNPMYTPRELAYQLQDSGAQTLVILDLLWPRYAEIQNEHPLKTAITTGIQDYLPFPKNLLFPLKARREKRWVHLPQYPWRHDLKTLLKRHAPTPTPVPTDPDDLALLQYTGGTTGRPKGAMLTHRNLVANVHQILAWAPQLERGREVILCVLPFFHVYGMTVGMNYGIALGAKLVLLPRFEVKEVVEALEKHKVTLFPGVPTLYVAVNNFPGIEQRKVDTLKVCNSGAAPLPVEVLEEFEKRTGAKIAEGYGLTEASPVTHSNPVHGTRKKGSIGVPLPSVDAQVLGPDGQPLPPGQIGELAVKGPNIMKGYWNRPEETQQALKNGWLLTGDMARMDEDGYFYIVDRKKDLIIAGGYNIYPREVEEVLYAHPAVKEAAVIGVPDPYRGETVKAYVVLKDEYRGKITQADLEQHCRAHLAAYKVPKQWAFKTELPKTAVGKILRRALREAEAAEEEQAT
ncbi:long-chain-fatty-acid--CoA ligase [Marinithermus hydrothermalis]|uniref:Long-chain-fatty-acid--CoA ligase n=1 Tax=Marinithermus hydrothermalis (strain DSM 14884 / JCM 11576 / T1) TaxID=869210 RepID=F2NLM5_MARHT|nr:long-chain fatty acid--CoA ligase [Marinithermus hydrothermalis]AEB12124.1 Long-chain-fatty-acid--CoA ligase [Marinithermus hydrothermalis DSM 14884]